MEYQSIASQTYSCVLLAGPLHPASESEGFEAFHVRGNGAPSCAHLLPFYHDEPRIRWSS